MNINKRKGEKIWTLHMYICNVGVCTTSEHNECNILFVSS
jgi:hypothetical protein